MHIRTIVLMSGLLLSAASCVAMDTRGELREAISAHDLGRVHAAVTALRPTREDDGFLSELLEAYGLALKVRDVGIARFLRDALHDQRTHIHENELRANGYRTRHTVSYTPFLGMSFDATHLENKLLMGGVRAAIRDGDSVAVDFFIDLLFADYPGPAMMHLVEQAARSNFRLLISRLIARSFVDTAMLKIVRAHLERKLADEKNFDLLPSLFAKYYVQDIALLTGFIEDASGERGDSSVSASGGPGDDAS